MRLRAIILGCGSSGGVPRIGGPDGKGDWGDCDPSNPKNRRQRCSLIVQRADEKAGWNSSALTTILVDPSPDMRMQLLDNSIGRLDAVLNTHDHADQSHGIDDLRALVLQQMKRMPFYFSEMTSPNLRSRFHYCFESNKETGYPAILDAKPLNPSKVFEIDGPTGPIPTCPILLQHGPVPSFGFRFGTDGGEGLVYSPDLDDVPSQSWPLIEGADIWIVDALRYRPHPSHAHVDKTLSWLKRAQVNRGVLTNLHVDLDYDELTSKMPAHVTPAYDGMIVETVLHP